MNAEIKQPENLLNDRTKLIELIYRLLEDILATTSEMPKGNSKFHAKQVPAMSVRDYLSRSSLLTKESASIAIVQTRLT
jgi:hypothetical protein